MNARIPIALMALSVSACSSTHLLYAHDTTVGISVAAGAEGTAKFSLGYDRETFALVPKKSGTGEAMSLAGTSCVYSSPWGQRIQFTHIVATGATAEGIAKELSATKGSIAEFASLAQKGATTCD